MLIIGLSGGSRIGDELLCAWFQGLRRGEATPHTKPHALCGTVLVWYSQTAVMVPIGRREKRGGDSSFRKDCFDGLNGSVGKQHDTPTGVPSYLQALSLNRQPFIAPSASNNQPLSPESGKVKRTCPVTSRSWCNLRI